MRSIPKFSRRFFYSNEAASSVGSIIVEIKAIEGETPYFGYKSSWYVVRSECAADLALFIKDLSNGALQPDLFWRRDWKVEVSSAYEGWIVLLCGLTPDHYESIGRCKDFLCLLSERFVEAQHFGTHRVSDYHCWAKAVEGRLVRFYSFAGETIEDFCEGDEPLEVERNATNNPALLPEVQVNDFKTSDVIVPNEEMVMEHAERWSFNPDRLSQQQFEEIWTGGIRIVRTK